MANFAAAAALAVTPLAAKADDAALISYPQLLEEISGGKVERLAFSADEKSVMLQVSLRAIS